MKEWEDFEKALKVEFTQLVNKCLKLEEALTRDSAFKMDKKERKIMQKQLKGMKLYLLALKERLKLYESRYRK